MQLSAGLQWIKNIRTDFNGVASLYDIFNLQDCQCTQADESTLSQKELTCTRTISSRRLHFK